MIINVRWQLITEAQGHALRGAFPELKTFSSCTDPFGQFGSPSITDEWGLPGADVAMLKAISAYQRREDFKDGQNYPERLDSKYFIAIITEEFE